MAVTVEKVTTDALGLPSAGRARLVEKLLESLSGETDRKIERVHLDEIRRRREDAHMGKTALVDGDEALRRARTALRR
jgi:hypothetical protein